MSTYAKDVNREKTRKLRELLEELPPSCQDFIRSIEPRTSILTRLNYCYDLRIFFTFLTEKIPEFRQKSMDSIQTSDLDKLDINHMELYLEYLTLYSRNDRDLENDASGKSRKLASLRSYFKYLYQLEWIERDVASLANFPKIRQKPILYLEPDEVAKLLDLVESGESMTETQRRYHRKTRTRDLALLTTLLGTGMRVSECIGLDLGDVDFNVNGLRITRKGGDQQIVYFGHEVEQALKDYLVERNAITPLPGHENALFLSSQKKRINVRSVENLVKKYASVAAPLKKITPHKLRSTFGTALYQETNDIYLVAQVLGHKDVNTTKKHYAATDDESLRRAAQVIKLRDDGE
ncbi:tyrosine-type recombinase/integrase [Gehongia tenuis]|uniref:Tyrosine-type recombinase/integrase n=1 Tax=Gehongia tenuis TaxID=2763655 RepID=A0A926D4I9_9FIRM|nr:tyrosine-type recombinase/integrase [Gehongia tenuis]MBC8531208.1 tyrosine-type recombinase/integrase [Gehongia tenuis]